MNELKAPSTFSFIKRISVSDNSNSGVIELVRFDNNNVATFAANQNDYYCFHSIFVEHLQCTVSLASFAASPIPDIQSYDTQATIQAKTLQAQKNAAKIGIDLHLQVGGQWIPKARGIVLQNFGSEWYVPFLPYLTDRDVALFGKDEKLGVSLRNLGSGLLGSDDQLIFHGAYRHELSAIERRSAQRLTTMHSSSLVGWTVRQIKPSNESRRMLWIQNPGPLPIRVVFGDGDIDNGVLIGSDFLFNWKSGGDFYISEAVSARVEGGGEQQQQLTIMEGFLV